MKEFNLNEYFKNINQKVMTRSGREVRIFATDGHKNFPVIGLVEGESFPRAWSKYGKFSSNYLFDLVFTEESEFEKNFVQLAIDLDYGDYEKLKVRDESNFKAWATKKAKEFFALAKKEIKRQSEHIKKQDNISEFEKELAEAYEWAKSTDREDFVKEFAPKLFKLAKDQFESEIIHDKKVLSNILESSND